ncbi:uncharacterized protein LOC135396036 isoform X2 [Ornithodoros turicata]|uniref:uncharacterized protein LOC135396036 isoform X2 n=1 Tax=Ornithodoros turicata TaxID=34597 RepID=UPI0031389D9F
MCSARLALGLHYGEYVAGLVLSTIKEKADLKLEQQEAEGHTHGYLRVNEAPIRGIESFKFLILQSQIVDKVHDVVMRIRASALECVAPIEGRINDVVMSPPLMVRLTQKSCTFDIILTVKEGMVNVSSVTYKAGEVPTVSSNDGRYPTVSVMQDHIVEVYLENTKNELPKQLKRMLTGNHIFDLGLFHVKRHSDRLERLFSDFEAHVERVVETTHFLLRDEL